MKAPSLKRGYTDPNPHRHRRSGQAWIRVEARGSLGGLDLGIKYKHFEYYEDDDRTQDSDAQRLRLNIGFGRWLSPYRGFRAELGFDYDRNSGDSSVSLSLSLDRSNGRYYRDFRPGDLSFRNLRQRRALERHAGEGWE